ncbi:MAG: hypothetical protein JZU60_01260 [Ilumatobacteraceae bacterium]|jgi:hypothetical protein|nr:hypothetical protein [Ilumatobacteraceae bacterium]
MSDPVLNAATPSQSKLELLRLHFPQAVETDADGRIRINAAALQMAIDPGNLAGIHVKEDGYELRCVGKREAYHSAFVPVQKILTPLPAESKHWDSTGNLLLSEGLPLTTVLHPVKDQRLYLAADVLLIVQAVPLDELIDTLHTLHTLQAAGTPELHLTVYAPWIANNNFMLGIKTVAESLGYSPDKLRLRG